jgi:hypothetical protein
MTHFKFVTGTGNRVQIGPHLIFNGQDTGLGFSESGLGCMVPEVRARNTGY